MWLSTTGELLRAERKETGCNLASPATRWFGCKQSWLRSNSDVARLDQRENHA
jgi:hypothetical protein